MKRGHLGAWLAVALGGIYFLAPLVATFEFSLRMRRGEYSFDAYRVVFASGNFQASFLYSTIVALVTIVVAALIVVPAAYFVQLRLPRLGGSSSSSRSCRSSFRRSCWCSGTSDSTAVRRCCR